MSSSSSSSSSSHWVYQEAVGHDDKDNRRGKKRKEPPNKTRNDDNQVLIPCQYLRYCATTGYQIKPPGLRVLTFPPGLVLFRGRREGSDFLPHRAGFYSDVVVAHSYGPTPNDCEAFALTREINLLDLSDRGTVIQLHNFLGQVNKEHQSMWDAYTGLGRTKLVSGWVDHEPPYLVDERSWYTLKPKDQIVITTNAYWSQEDAHNNIQLSTRIAMNIVCQLPFGLDGWVFGETYFYARGYEIVDQQTGKRRLSNRPENMAQEILLCNPREVLKPLDRKCDEFLGQDAYDRQRVTPQTWKTRLLAVQEEPR